MPRTQFDRELGGLFARMTELGGAVDKRICATYQALRSLDLEKAEEVVSGDNEIDDAVRQLEQVCMNLIALQQPIAGDLRRIAACLKILTDLEREADQCADICDILTAGNLQANRRILSHLVQMLEAAHGMFRRCVDVLLSRDVQEARAVCRADDEVDALFGRLVLEVCGAIAANPQNAMSDVDLIFIIKYIERMGDHATNIAEWVIYMETGEHPDLNAKTYGRE